MFWFWDAQFDMHGTTHSTLSLEEENWKAYALQYPEAGQWTRVMTIPHTVLSSVKREAEQLGLETPTTKRP